VEVPPQGNECLRPWLCCGTCFSWNEGKGLQPYWRNLQYLHKKSMDLQKTLWKFTSILQKSFQQKTYQLVMKTGDGSMKKLQTTTFDEYRKHEENSLRFCEGFSTKDILISHEDRWWQLEEITDHDVWWWLSGGCPEDTLRTNIYSYYLANCGTSNVRHYATRRKVVGSSFDEVNYFFFNLPNPSGSTRPWGLLSS
jgi:hypothetical protein